jgi:hypothetical protein
VEIGVEACVGLAALAARVQRRCGTSVALAASVQKRCGTSVALAASVQKRCGTSVALAASVRNDKKHGAEGSPSLRRAKRRPDTARRGRFRGRDAGAGLAASLQRCGEEPRRRLSAR